MADDLRVVVDTNVLVSGLLGNENSPSSQIIQAVRAQKIILVTSPVIIGEVESVINRDRIANLTRMSGEERASFIYGLIQRSEVTAGNQLAKRVGRDVQDDKFLACAHEAKADYIVTGDKDLLTLKEYAGIKIIRPRDFVELLD